MKTIEQIKARHAEEIERANTELQIAEMLPESLPAPTISNISKKPGEPFAWLSFHPEYGQDAKVFALNVLNTLEQNGAEIVPLTLCRWDDWRRSVAAGLVEEIPATKPGCFGSTYKLNGAEPIAPLWAEPNQHTKQEVRCFYRIGGKLFKITVEAPVAVHLSCRRVEYHGGWSFDGPATVHFPESWRTLSANGEPVAKISPHTKAFRDTEQGISGAIYWSPTTDQKAFPLTPAAMLAQLFIS